MSEKKNKFTKKLLLFIASMIVWFILTATFHLPSVIIGVIVSVFVSIWFSNIFTAEPEKFFNLKRMAWLLYYLPILFWYILLSNLDVAYRVIHPAMPIKPGIVKIRTNLKTDIGRVALANSITLTPGTLTVNITDDGYLYIHWIYVQSEDIQQASEKIAGRFEKILMEVFG